MRERELLIEIGCEEIPASWLPALTQQFGERVAARLAEHRLVAGGSVNAFSTPRRLTVWISAVAERQTDHEEAMTGPPVSVAFGPDGLPTPAAVGFARKHGVDVSALTRVETPKGTYLAYSKRERGKAAVDVLPAVLAGALRDLTFPKLMRWDAWLDDGHGEFLFGRPIRWMLFLYGGRVVPFVIKRSQLAGGSDVQEVHTGAVTYGHRFRATKGRPGRAIRVRNFSDYRARLLAQCVVLERADRQARITRDLDAGAKRLGGCVFAGAGHTTLLQEVPDLVEYPAVMAGGFAPEFLELPSEVLTTTMIHHQHFFPVCDDGGGLMPVFLAVVNTEAADEGAIARNAGRVLTARLRDAFFFWNADRRVTLESRVDRLSALVFHKKLGSYRDKAERIERLAGWVAREALGASEETVAYAARAARLAKCDLVTDMVREFTELQGTMGGVYGRTEGQPEEIWKAIYFHYLPVGVEADGPPSPAQLGKAAVSWAAVSIADKLDTLVGMFAIGEKPTGSRDPFGLRRAAHGLFRVLVDLRQLTGLRVRPALQPLLDAAVAPFLPFDSWDATQFAGFCSFMQERLSYVLEQRGFDLRNVRAVTRRAFDRIRPADELGKLEVLPEFTATPDFIQLATAFKRVRNLAIQLPVDLFDLEEKTGARLEDMLVEPAERTLLEQLNSRQPRIEGFIESGESFRDAFTEAAKFGPAIARFFDEVLVMTEDARLRIGRLRLLRRLEFLMLKLADISEIVREES